MVAQALRGEAAQNPLTLWAPADKLAPTADNDPEETAVPEPAKHLDTAAEAVRAFNHATLTTSPEWEHPGDTYDALGNLSHLAGMLSQATLQSVLPVTRAFEAGRLRIDGSGDDQQAVQNLLDARQDAMAAAAAFMAAVQRMHNAVAPMGADVIDLPD